MTTTPPSQMLLHSVNPKSQPSSIEVVQHNHHSDLDNESISGSASIRTDCTTVPAANPRRITLSPPTMNIEEQHSREIRDLLERIIEAFPLNFQPAFAFVVNGATMDVLGTTVENLRDMFASQYRSFLHEDPPQQLDNDFTLLGGYIHSGQAGLVAYHASRLAMRNNPPAVVAAQPNNGDSVSALAEDPSEQSGNPIHLVGHHEDLVQLDERSNQTESAVGLPLSESS